MLAYVVALLTLTPADVVGVVALDDRALPFERELAAQLRAGKPPADGGPTLVEGRDAVLARADASTAASSSSSSSSGARATELLKVGEDLMLAFEHARAAATLAECAAILEPTLAQDNVEAWTRARTLEGVAWHESGNAAAAQDAFTKLLALRADVTPDASLLSPAARDVFDAARRAVLARGAGTIEVRSTPAGANVVVDGVARGRTPIAVTGIVAGAVHRVRVAAPGMVAHAAEVKVDANALVAHDVTLAPGPFAQLLNEASTDTASLAPRLEAAMRSAGIARLLLVKLRGDVVMVRELGRGDRAVHASFGGAGAPPPASGGDVLAKLDAPNTSLDFSATLFGTALTAPSGAPVDDGLPLWGIAAASVGVLIIGGAIATGVVLLWPQPPKERALGIILELPAP